MQSLIPRFPRLLSRTSAVLAFASASLFACAASHPAIPLAGQSWSVTFADSTCVLSGSDQRVTAGDCGEHRKLVVSASMAKSLGTKVQELKAAREPAAGGAQSVLRSGAIGVVIEPAQAASLLREMQGYLDRAEIAARERTFLESTEDIACPAGQRLLTFQGCSGMPGVSDVCGPPVHTCGAATPTGASCEHNAGCASNRCSAARVCE